jgi:hypothetical protein
VLPKPVGDLTTCSQHEETRQTYLGLNLQLISAPLTVLRSTLWITIQTKNAVFWDVPPCRSCVNRRFGGTYRLHLQGSKIREPETSVSRQQQTSVHTRSTRRHIPEDGILHTHRRGNLKSYMQYK